METGRILEIIENTKKAVYLAGFNNARVINIYKEMIDIIELEIELNKDISNEEDF